MAPLSSYQPFKSLFIGWFALKTPIYFVLLAILYLPERLRPLPEWSWKVSFHSALLRSFVQFLADTRTQRAPQLEPGKAKERFVLVEPPSDDVFLGVLAPGTARPAPVGAIWFPSPVRRGAADLKDKKVVLHFPGGAFVAAMDINLIGPRVAKMVSRHLRADHVLVAQYRLARDAATRFPAAAQDLLTFYHYVLSLGVEPRNVVLSGESAGGNLVLALMRHLEAAAAQEQAAALPLPGGAMVFSPWVHVTADAGRVYERSSYSRTDVLTSDVLQWGADAYIPEEGDFEREARPFVSPLHHPFRTTIPLFLNAGTAEAFYASVKSFAGEMADLNGDDLVRFHGTEHAPHGILISFESIGFEVQLATAIEDAQSFFKRRSSSTEIIKECD